MSVTVTPEHAQEAYDPARTVFPAGPDGGMPPEPRRLREQLGPLSEASVFYRQAGEVATVGAAERTGTGGAAHPARAPRSPETPLLNVRTPYVEARRPRAEQEFREGGHTT